MILSLIGLIATVYQGGAQTEAAPPVTKPGALIGLAFKKYHDAQSLAGTIRLTQTAQSVTIVVDTQVAYDRPSKLLIRQQKGGSQPQNILSVSDGRYFWYDKPAGVYGPPRLQEPVSQHQTTQTLDQMYSAASRGLADRSAVLDIVFARNEDLKEVKSHWTNLHFNGTAQIRSREVQLIEGDYCAIPGEEPNGAFQLSITNTGDLMRYIVKERYAVPGQESQTVEVTSTWDANLKVGGFNDPAIYAVRR
ncbi:hypothetical protein [Fimbriimonas ginsengisoli]|uniref:Uncharacterized protein n=1 Tax=Fimbriimonas ginsengisoli Gsoil 348 TaxID=661478 RepID=A0A068NXM0_FIMGI|nr:hypothetical protein [Fimbriimonas ginsengisoli]AIE87505.1 hypothetical protein OP10G_4137 [Fimbriimonas ginsengisoli Gsoil 348]